MPGGARRRSSVIFHRNSLDVVVQGQVPGLERELPQLGGFERFRGGGIPFGPPLPNEAQDATDPLVVVVMPMGNNNFRDVRKFWVGYHGCFLEGRFEDGSVVIPTLPSVHQDIRIVPSNEIGVCSYCIGEKLCDMARLAIGLRTL